jgi:DNA-binding CsgD family transcriptional regulator
VTLHQLPMATFDVLDDGHPHLALVPDPDRLMVCDQTGSVYRHALLTGSVRVCPEIATDLDLPMHHLEELIKRLIDLRLLRPDPADRHGFTPVDPDVAAASLISPLEGEIHHRRDLIASIRAQLSSLLPMYSEARPPRESNVDIHMLRDRTEVRGALALAVNACRDELVSIRPRGSSWEDTTGDDEALARDLAVLHQGVRMRAIYQHSARANLTSRAYVKRIVAAGAEVRTTNELPSPFLVFDRAVAFVPDQGGGALELPNPALSTLLYEVFEYIWETGTPYGATEAGYQGIADDILRDVAKLLADGLTDEAISRRLGMSLRSVRRHVARLMKALNSVSRFQAGTRAVDVGIISA